jgi:hypothetical protein
MITGWTAVATVMTAAASDGGSTDWIGIAAVITAAAAGIASVITIIWNGRILRKQLVGQAEQQHKQQLADMAATALKHFTGGTQNRSAGIAALRIVRAGSKDFDGDEVWKTYGPAIQGLLYSQLLYLYEKGAPERDARGKDTREKDEKKGINKTEPHEAANIELMSDWLFGKDFQLDSQMKAKLEEAQRHYEAPPQQVAAYDSQS